MIALLLSVALAAPAGPDRVLVTAYQGTGRVPEQVQRLQRALESQVEARGWPVVPTAEAERQGRAAVMCGEDVPCLATIGERVEARWVLAFAIGAVGTRTLVSAVLVDARTPEKRQQLSESLSSFPVDAGPLAGRVVEELFSGLEPGVYPGAASLTPPAPPSGPASPRPVPPALVGTFIGAGALVVAGASLTVISGISYGQLPTLSRELRPEADARQRGLNLAADVVMIAAGVATAVAVVLLIIHAARQPPPAGAPAP